MIVIHDESASATPDQAGKAPQKLARSTRCRPPQLTGGGPERWQSVCIYRPSRPEHDTPTPCSWWQCSRLSLKSERRAISTLRLPVASWSQNWLRACEAPDEQDKPAIDSSEKNAFVAVLAEPADQPVAQARERRQNVDAEKDDDADRVMSALRWLADVDAAD